MKAGANAPRILVCSILALLCLVGRAHGASGAPGKPAGRNTPRGLEDARLVGREDPGRKEASS